MKTTYRIFCVICICFGLMGCSDFLEEQVPQATLTQDGMVIYQFTNLLI